jgi:hypothetical protein
VPTHTHLHHHNRNLLLLSNSDDLMLLSGNKISSVFEDGKHVGKSRWKRGGVRSVGLAFKDN